jgi:hypothetical protein
VSQYAVKLSVLYREYQEHLRDHPQELSEMRVKLRSLDGEVLRLKGFEAEVGQLQTLVIRESTTFIVD